MTIRIGLIAKIGQTESERLQELLESIGKADENGTMVYAIGQDAATAPTEGWSTEIPQAANPGTYYVWYKAKGNEGYADSEPACVAATIGKKTFKVTAVSSYAFTGNDNLRSIRIGKNVKRISPYAFYGCVKLKTLNVNNKSKKIHMAKHP